MKNLTLKDNEIHIWHATITIDKKRESDCLQFLSQDERQRAARFHFKKDRAGYTAARSILRLLLGHYLNQEPASLRFIYSTHGKPLLNPQSETTTNLEFNLSHSAGKALFAFSLNCPVGIDLEHLRTNTDILSLAERFFTPGEYKDLTSLPQEDQLEAFFRCWVRKEAFIKAKEQGLSLGLSKFEVSLKPDELPILKHTFYQEKDAKNWSLFDIEVEDGYKAALAFWGKNAEVRSFQWTWVTGK